ncbi:uncharacterized protein LOC118644880 [Monomorium pharaonis]|uniref:uncharacterized protein LOC118644880 n=1 Tax=Monomorium pharaonis TaxID=307658 RepID=UPI001747B2A4|nr:uncharacterized protein LOC118644880 [Monomorium pharaonis]
MEAIKKFIVAEFADGLQIIPAKWLNTSRNKCIWPSHYKTMRRLHSAIITEELPKDETDWDKLLIKRIFGSADTYEKAMEKLTLAQDTSNVDTGLSSDELKQRNKKRRREKAKRKLSSSLEDDLLCFTENKENYPHGNKQLPPFPELDKFTQKKQKS